MAQVWLWQWIPNASWNLIRLGLLDCRYQYSIILCDPSCYPSASQSSPALSLRGLDPLREFNNSVQNFAAVPITT